MQVAEMGSTLFGRPTTIAFAVEGVILKDSNIFLFDEATANLDKETDRLVQEIMRKCWAGKLKLSLLIDWTQSLTS